MRELWRRTAAWLRRRSLDRDLDEELRFHLDLKERETGDRAAATRALGSALLVRDRARDAWGWRRGPADKPAPLAMRTIAIVRSDCPRCPSSAAGE